MTTKEEWLVIAKRCEKATEGDGAIDKAIIAALGYSWRGMDYWDNATTTKMLRGSTLYTYSIDAIAGLIERELPNHAWSIVHRLTIPGMKPNGQIWTGDERLMKHGEAATPALALCSAFARAMAERA